MRTYSRESIHVCVNVPAEFRAQARAAHRERPSRVVSIMTDETRRDETSWLPFPFVFFLPCLAGSRWIHSGVVGVGGVIGALLSLISATMTLAPTHVCVCVCVVCVWEKESDYVVGLFVSKP